MNRKRECLYAVFILIAMVAILYLIGVIPGSL